MPKRKKESIPGSSDQKFTWKATGNHDKFEDAAEHCLELTEKLDANEGLKIKKRKDHFEVRVGTPVKEVKNAD